MTIYFKPTGSLDINTDPTELPEQSQSGSIASGALARLKNMRQERGGVAQQRYGSTMLVALETDDTPDLLFDASGHRYIFAGEDIYYDEAIINTDGFQVASPTFDPVAGSYAAEQDVTISTVTEFAEIYYTLDGTDPTRQSAKYYVPVTVPASSYLKAFAIDPRGYLEDSDIVTGYYVTFAQNILITETDSDTLITETDSDTLTTEGP